MVETSPEVMQVPWSLLELTKISEISTPIKIEKRYNRRYNCTPWYVIWYLVHSIVCRIHTFLVSQQLYCTNLESRPKGNVVH
jgi:hypothetical protein